MPAEMMALIAADSIAPAFELDRIHAALLQKAARVSQGVGNGCLIRHKRHIAHQMCPRNAARHGAAVVQHFLHRYGKRVFVAQHDHAERVADQDAVYSGAIQGNGRRIIVGGQESNRLPMQLFWPAAFGY